MPPDKPPPPAPPQPTEDDLELDRDMTRCSARRQLSTVLSALFVVSAFAVQAESMHRLNQSTQRSDPWNRVVGLPPGSEVEVTLTDGSKVSGRIVAVRQDVLIVENVKASLAAAGQPVNAGGETRTIPRANVGKVSVRAPRPGLPRVYDVTVIAVKPDWGVCCDTGTLGYSFLGFLDAGGSSLPVGWLVSMDPVKWRLGRFQIRATGELAGNYWRSLGRLQMAHVFQGGITAREKGNRWFAPFGRFMVGAAKVNCCRLSGTALLVEPGIGVDFGDLTKWSAHPYRIGVGFPVLFKDGRVVKSVRVQAGFRFGSY